jgi:hypothetical protein
MKPLTLRLNCAAFALLLTLMLAGIPGVFAASPPVPTPVSTAASGCAGETWSVFITQQGHGKARVNGPGGLDPKGFRESGNTSFTLTAHFTSALRNGRMRWISRDLNWFGYSTYDVPECQKVSCTSAGNIELGPADYDYTAMTSEQRSDWIDQITWRCQMEDYGNHGSPSLWNADHEGWFSLKVTSQAPTFGGCVDPGYSPGTPPTVSFPRLPARTDPRWRYGSAYAEWVDEYGGTLTSVILEERGAEKVTIEAQPSTILPNQTRGNNDEGTSQLSVKLTCDGVPLQKHWVGLRIDPQPGSGGHNHLGSPQFPRPRGKLIVGPNKTDCGGDTGKPDDSDCVTLKTDDNGEAKVKFEVPLTGSYDHASYGWYQSGVAGTYTITAKSSEVAPYGAIVGVAKASTDVRAQIDAESQTDANKLLGPLKQSTFLTEERGAGTTVHPAGDYGTPGTLRAFEALAEDFHRQVQAHYDSLGKCRQQDEWEDPRKISVSVNDIALWAGGIFDYKSTWRPGHQTHNKGEGGDFNRFGAGAGFNFQSVPSDCNGGTAMKQWWYAHLLLDLGTKYGHWDCTDLSAGALSSSDLNAIAWNPYAFGVLNHLACKAGESPEQEGGYSGQKQAFSDPTYFPPKLHLHVED